MQKNGTGSLSYTVHKNCKWMNDLNIGPESINFQEHTGTKFLDFGLGKESLDQTPNAKATDAKINK